MTPASGGVKDHNFLATRVNRNINYIFGILMSRAIDWYTNESILRGSGGGRGTWGGGSRIYWAIFTKCYIYFWNPQLKPSRLVPLLGDLIKGCGLGAWS